jgi:L-threonylcarbamoyladenylate synthase
LERTDRTTGEGGRGPGDASGELSAAVAALRSGDLLILPTETVYGLAADAANAEAVAKIFEAKGRSRSSTTPPGAWPRPSGPVP